MEELIEIRCSSCRALLYKTNTQVSGINEIRCRRCKNYNLIVFPTGEHSRFLMSYEEYKLTPKKDVWRYAVGMILSATALITGISSQKTETRVQENPIH